MNQIDKLLAIEEIKQLKARYFRFVDTKDWTGFAGLFAADAVFDLSDDLPGMVHPFLALLQPLHRAQGHPGVQRYKEKSSQQHHRHPSPARSLLVASCNFCHQ